MNSLSKKNSPSHQKNSVSESLENNIKYDHLGDFVLGAIDGCVTTFAVVAGVYGSGMPARVAFVLGVANLIADGFSMAAGNYQKAQSDQELVEKIRKIEEQHIEEVPDVEREEIRHIYKKKGFEGPILEEIVKVITSDKKRWVDTMITEEFGMPLETPNAIKSALSTFLAFVIVGLIPLLPFLFSLNFTTRARFIGSIILTGITFFVIGSIRGKLLHRPIIKSGLETLSIGGLAAFLSYVIGFLLKGYQ